MGKMIKSLAKKGKSAARKAYNKVETKVLAAAGRRAVRRKFKTVATVGKKAAKSAVAAGALAAAGVVVKEIRRRQSPT